MMRAVSSVARKQKHGALPWAKPVSNCAQLRDGLHDVNHDLQQREGAGMYISYKYYTHSTELGVKLEPPSAPLPFASGQRGQFYG